MTTVKRMDDRLIFDFPGFSKKETEKFADLIVSEADKPFIGKKLRKKAKIKKNDYISYHHSNGTRFVWT